MKKIYTLLKFFLLIPAFVLISYKSQAQTGVYMYLLDTNYNPLSDVPGDSTPFQLVMEGIPPSINMSDVNVFVQDPDSSGVIFEVNGAVQTYGGSTGTVLYPRISVKFNTPNQPRTQSITFKITIRSKVPPFPSSTLLVFAQTFSTDELLPIVLQSFTATPVGSSVNLHWTTASELNNKAFMVQRSDNSKTYTSLTTIAGAGTSTVPRNYQYTDNNLIDGLYFYRLLQQDFDGTITVSKVVEVTVNGHFIGSVELYPNPFNGVINLKGVTPQDVQVNTVKVTDLSGRPVPFQITNGTSIILPDNLASGEYFITLKGQTYKVIKQ